MGFQQGLSGLNASSKALDVIGNNVANSSTVGFKSSTAAFSDVFAASMAGSSQIGIGTSVGAVSQNYTQGDITTTSNTLDLAINGTGFYRMDDNGSITWSRSGQFEVDKNGYIVNSSGAKLTGYLANASNVIVPSTPADIYINTASLQPQATGASASASGVEINFNLNSTDSAKTAATFSSSDPTTYNSSTSVTVYDSLGNSHLMSLYFVKTASNNWNMYSSLDGASITNGTPGANATGPHAITFTSSGAIQTPSPASFTVGFTPATGASAMSFPINITGSTQYGTTFGVNSVTQDGYTSGRLSGLSIAADGTIQGRYSNGQSRDLAQVVLGTFNNPNGLQAMGGNQWAETASSGQPIIGVPGSGNLGVIQSAAVEESNVDLTAQLVNMITAQRSYQANAETIKTQDQVLQTLVNLR